MKKILLFVALVCFCSAGYAQVKGGLKAGLNFANTDIDADGIDPDSRTGYHAGLFLEIGLAGFHIMPEVLYSFKGADDYDFAYLEVPILFKKNFAKVLNIHLGPQFGFLTSAEFDAGVLGDVDIQDELKSTDLSAVIGAGVDLPAGISGGVRYVFGLSDVNDGFISSDTEIRNRTLQVYVGYKLFGN